LLAYFWRIAVRGQRSDVHANIQGGNLEVSSPWKRHRTNVGHQVDQQSAQFVDPRGRWVQNGQFVDGDDSSQSSSSEIDGFSSGVPGGSKLPSRFKSSLPGGSSKSQCIKSIESGHSKTNQQDSSVPPGRHFYWEQRFATNNYYYLIKEDTHWCGLGDEFRSSYAIRIVQSLTLANYLNAFYAVLEAMA